MSRKCVASFAVGVAVFLASTVALAHHGTNASYDPRKEVTLTGVVTRFIMVNPHGQLFWDVKGPDGKVVTWGGELHSIGLLRRSGWTRETLKAGDTVSVRGYPSRAGTPFMVVQEAGGRHESPRLQVERATDERLETFCVPSEEEAFNKAIRDPAGGVVK